MIINGKEISEKIKEEIAAEVKALKDKGISCGLAVILVGDDPASAVYVRNKKLACEKVGIYSEVYTLPANSAEADVLDLISTLNKREDINGILCQLPLPKHIDEQKIINAIDKDKDVDAFNPYNVGKIMLGDPVFLPCTPAGVMELLKYSDVEIAGKNCVVLGRSNIVGKPMAMLLMKADATVTVCHSKTKNIKEITAGADILVAAVGKPKFVTADMVKSGAVVIDVGINRTEDGKLCGDVDFEKVVNKASKITPVPGGVGVMTVTMLLKNTVTAAKKQGGIL